ncbi:MAG: hypothetical protein JSR97_06275 [Verrucomicrobia bacterium]|nr:hypothetical protein [Verrucomicrobiota bacterium]
MRSLLLLILCLVPPLYAVKVDSSLKTFEQRETQKKVDVYDFEGDYPQLEKIDIDARRKKCVEFNLCGSYPALEKIVYEGGFGSLDSRLTGKYPLLKQIEFLCGNAKMDFDLKGDWQRSCKMTIQGAKEPIVLKLPSDIGIVAHVHSKLGAKVEAGPLKKQGWWHMVQRTYTNDLADTAEVVLTLDINIADGVVVFE